LARASLLRLRSYARLIRLSRRGHCVVLRHSPGDPFLFAASFFFKTYYTVHHTFEEDELAVSSFRSARLQLALERLLGRRVVARARGIICVTPEIARYELQRIPGRTERGVIVYPNGVAYEDSMRTPLDRRGERPEIVFVASHFVHWHGLEGLLASLSSSPTDGLLHLVGAVPVPLLQQAQRDPRVRIHGVLNPSAVDDVVAHGWVGLSSFGLAEKGMTEACTLKVREYLRAGVPAYAGHRDSALPTDFAYFHNGPADWDAIVAYARATRGVARETVSSAARPFIDKAVLLQRLYQSLEALPEASSTFTRAGEPSKP
jgi:glycosyltransferase involved in cell wall biosynthesis